MAVTGKHIMIVDDDPGILDALKIIFERAGYRVTAMEDGEPLLGLEFMLPDLYILDKQLAGIDGIDICRFLKKQVRSKKVPVIILSATPNVYKLAMNACADDFLEKPFKMQELLNMVEDHLTQP
jgi:DNA-binding response OmpR family regulator